MTLLGKPGLKEAEKKHEEERKNLEKEVSQQKSEIKNNLKKVEVKGIFGNKTK